MNWNPTCAGGAGGANSGWPAAGARLLREPLARQFFQIEKRTMTVGRRDRGRRGAEAVVEDLERQRPRIARLDHARGEACEVEVAWPGTSGNGGSIRARPSRALAHRRSARTRSGRRGCPRSRPANRRATACGSCRAPGRGAGCSRHSRVSTHGRSASRRGPTRALRTRRPRRPAARLRRARRAGRRAARRPRSCRPTRCCTGCGRCRAHASRRTCA